MRRSRAADQPAASLARGHRAGDASGRPIHRVMESWQRMPARASMDLPRRRSRFGATTCSPDSSDIEPATRGRCRFAAPAICRPRRAASSAGAVSAHRFLGADHLGRQLRPHLLRREGAGGASPSGSSVFMAQPLQRCSTTSACRRSSWTRRPRIINEDAIVSCAGRTTTRSSRPRARCCGRRTSTSACASATMSAALLSRELQIPYIVEYNGSEISMQQELRQDGAVLRRRVPRRPRRRRSVRRR